MNIEVASICDAATANGPGGRLNILGAFDRIFAQFPFVIPQFSAVFRIRYMRVEAGIHKLRLTFEDVVGKDIIPPMQSEVPFQEVAKGFDTAAMNMILNIQRLPIKRPDKYIVRLFIDDAEFISLPLYILDQKNFDPNQPKPVAEGEEEIPN
ncbi:MAG: hypothetical protein HUK21_06350 [Fibrobacteraceae bacterium]|nr:hypothetical protein [Fibrobacteraceae bacterium]